MSPVMTKIGDFVGSSGQSSVVVFSGGVGVEQLNTFTH